MIENQQKTLSGPQGVLLGVPRDPQITQMAIQDATMCLPKLTNIRLWCQKGGKPESSSLNTAVERPACCQNLGGEKLFRVDGMPAYAD